MTPREPVVGLNMPYQDVAAGGRVHRIGTAQREILRLMLAEEPGGDGVRRMARADLMAHLKMGQRGEATPGTRYRAIDRACAAGRLRKGGERTMPTERGRKAKPVELTALGVEVARQIGLIGEAADGRR
jgi:hypothetical protein